MARIATRQAAHSHAIVVIDDDEYLARSFHALLTREGHTVTIATDPREGVERVRALRPHLVLLDYMMPEMNGADVVRAIRQFDTQTQIILVTGYTGEQPGRKLLEELDIQGYHDKGHGPDRLLVLVDAALKYYRLIDRLEQQRARLLRLVEAAPTISKLRPVDELFDVALALFVRMLDGSGNALVATTNSGLFVMESTGEGISIRAGTGCYEGVRALSDLSPAMVDLIRDALASERPLHLPPGIVCVPMRTREGDRGCIAVEAATVPPEDSTELCAIYAGMVVQALENILLYDRATHDPLCRIWNRSAGLRRLADGLKLDGRNGTHTAVLLADIDHFKRVNDEHGHAAGDLALHAVANAMVQAARSTDTVCRYGGEEFLVILPSTDEAAAMSVAEKLRAAIEQLVVRFDTATLSLTASFGVAVAAPTAFEPEAVEALVRHADGAMYAAKAAGRNRVALATAPTKPPVD